MADIKRIKCPHCKGVCAVQAEGAGANISTDKGARIIDGAADKPVFPASIICPYCAKTFDVVTE